MKKFYELLEADFALARHQCRSAWRTVAPSRWTLFPAVFAIVVFGMSGALAIWFGLSELLRGTSPFHQPAAGTTLPSVESVLKIALTIVAGLGGVVALTVAYRRQRNLETGRFAQRFADAAAQLGGASAAVRIAGVYAMSALADDSTGLRLQQCIDSLCAYLRLPYQADPGGGFLESAVITKTATNPANQVYTTQKTDRHQPQEREVRLTIIRIIRDHLRPEAPRSWQGCDFNFTGATFDCGSFAKAVFSGGDVSFENTMFTGRDISFYKTQFTGGRVSFVDARFADGKVSFLEARFSGAEVLFLDAEFSGSIVRFYKTKFMQGAVSFADARFTGGSVSFLRAEFTGGSLSFSQSHLMGGLMSFYDAQFAGADVTFLRSEFNGTLIDLRWPKSWLTAPTGIRADDAGVSLPVAWVGDPRDLPPL